MRKPKLTTTPYGDFFIAESTGDFLKFLASRIKGSKILGDYLSIDVQGIHVMVKARFAGEAQKTFELRPFSQIFLSMSICRGNSVNDKYVPWAINRSSEAIEDVLINKRQWHVYCGPKPRMAKKTNRMNIISSGDTVRPWMLIPKNRLSLLKSFSRDDKMYTPDEIVTYIEAFGFNAVVKAPKWNAGLQNQVDYAQKSRFWKQ
jgi:hypothetical protein